MATTMQGTWAARPGQWARALERALAEGLDVLVEPVSGEAFVESASRPGTLYQVTATSCTCLAGREGMPCKHRACYLAQIGELPLDAPPAVTIVMGPELGRLSTEVAWRDGAADVLRDLEQEAREAEDQATIDCPDCCGCGVVVYRSHEQLCDVCDGCGLIAA